MIADGSPDGVSDAHDFSSASHPSGQRFLGHPRELRIARWSWAVETGGSSVSGERPRPEIGLLRQNHTMAASLYGPGQSRFARYLERREQRRPDPVARELRARLL